MTFKVKLFAKDYVRLNYTLVYRKITAKLAAILGLLLLVAPLLYYTDILPNIYSANSDLMLPLAMGTFLTIVIPISIYFVAKRNFNLSLRLQEEIEYDITPAILRLTGNSFKSELTWEKTYKIEELNKWFLIYQNPKAANAIPKYNLTPAEITELRKIFAELKNVKVVAK